MAPPKGTARIDSDRCKGCGLCAVVCPEKIITICDRKVNVKGYCPAEVSHPDDCIGCGNCALICPDAVITVERHERRRRVEHV